MSLGVESSFSWCPDCKSTNITSNIRYTSDDSRVIGGHKCLDCGWESDGYNDTETEIGCDRDQGDETDEI